MPTSFLFAADAKIRTTLETDPADAEAAILCFGFQIDERVDYTAVMNAFSALPAVKRVRLDLSQTRRINSPGTRAWVQLMGELQRRFTVEFSYVSEPLMDLSSMIPTVLGQPRTKIDRIEVPFHCPKCDMTCSPGVPASQLVSEGQLTIPEQKCPECQRPLELDVVEAEYFSALLKSRS